MMTYIKYMSSKIKVEVKLKNPKIKVNAKPYPKGYVKAMKATDIPAKKYSSVFKKLKGTTYSKSVKSVSTMLDSKETVLTYEQLESLSNGRYLIKYSDGSKHEIIFQSGNRTKQIKNEMGSDEIGDFLNADDGITIMKLPDLDTPKVNTGGLASTKFADLGAKFLRSQGSEIPGVSHCVGKDGICRKIRIKAEQYFLEHQVDTPHGRGQICDNERYLRGRQRKHYRELLKLAQKLEQLFFQDYPEGCTIDQLKQICQKYKLKGSINFPYYREEYYINKDLVKPLISFKFHNVSQDHVEILLDGHQTCILDDDEFDEKYQLNEKGHMRKLFKLGREIYAFLDDFTVYVKRSCSAFWNPDHPYSKWVAATNPWKISNKSPYYNFIKNCTRIPTHYNCGVWTNYDKLKQQDKLGLKDYQHREIKTGLYAQDMTAAYTQWENCKHFKHFPGLPNWDMENPGPEIYLNNEGWWQVESEEDVQFWGRLKGFWTTVHLRHFTEMGFNFKVKYGMWSSCKAEIPQLPDLRDENGKRDKRYVVAVGMLSHEGSQIREWWDDPDNLLRRNPECDIKVQTFKRDTWKSGWVISSYIYACASVQIISRAYDIQRSAVGADVPQIYGIKVDAIITDRPFPAVGLFKKSEPLDSEVSKKTIWSGYAINNYNQQIKKKRETNRKHEHEKHIFHEQIMNLSGAGGTGKTQTIGDHFGHLDPLYIAPTKKTRDDKEDVFRQRVCMAGTERLYSCTNGVRPSIIVIDEIGITNGAQLRGHIDYALQHGVRLFLVGDQAQLGSQYAMDDLWETVNKYPTVTFTNNHRSCNARTKLFLQKMHRLSLKGDALDEMRKLCMTHLKRAKVADTKQYPIIRYYNKMDSEKDDRNIVTIDKFQGQTIPDGDTHVIWFSSSKTVGRAQDMPKIIYTMVSRFRNINDIRYIDSKGIRSPQTQSVL